MSWSVMARRVRDADRPLGQRVTALHSLLANHHAPLGFLGTRGYLRELVGAGRGKRWTEEQLLAALAALEESRNSLLRYRTVLAERRVREKAEGRRQLTRGDREALQRREWARDPAEAARRAPSRRDRRRASRAE